MSAHEPTILKRDVEQSNSPTKLSPDERRQSQGNQQNVDLLGTHAHHTSDQTDLQSLVNQKSNSPTTTNVAHGKSDLAEK